MKKEKTNKGITLIALIITIVVMLILVAVTLSIALGENGIVNNAKKAARDTNSAMENEADIANDVTYGDVQGIDNIVENLTNPKEKVLAEDLEEGDKVKVILKNVELQEEFDGKFGAITFDDNMCIIINPADESAISKGSVQVLYANINDEGAFIPSVSEENPAYLYLMNGTNALGNSITKTTWYKSVDAVTLEETNNLPSFEATIEMIEKDSSTTFEDIDAVVDFYK